MLNRHLFMCAVACVALTTAISRAATVYTEDFESATVGATAPSGWSATTSGNGSWAITDTDPIAGSQSYDLSVQDGGGGTSLVDLSSSIDTDPATALDFTVSSLFRLDPASTGGSGSVNFGLRLLSNSDGSLAYTMRTTTSGIIQIINGSGSPAVANETGVSISTAGDYLFTVTGTYYDSGSNDINDSLRLDFAVDGPGKSGILATLFDTTPLTGTYFGYTGSAGGDRELFLTVDDFEVATVPEPATGAFLGLALGAVMFARRRRS